MYSCVNIGCIPSALGLVQLRPPIGEPTFRRISIQPRTEYPCTQLSFYYPSIIQLPIIVQSYYPSSSRIVQSPIRIIQPLSFFDASKFEGDSNLRLKRECAGAGALKRRAPITQNPKLQLDALVGDSFSDKNSAIGESRRCLAVADGYHTKLVTSNCQ